MSPIKEGLVNTWNQPQLFSLIITILIILIVSLIIYFKVRKMEPHEAPKGIVLVAEAYLGMVENTFLTSTNGKISSAKYYIFTLATFLIVGNTVGIFGLEPISSSYSIPLVLALASWLGIYVVGFAHQKWRFFKRYINVLEVVGQFAPLISLGFRMYGNIIGGGTIILLIYMLAGYAWKQLPGLENNEWYFFAPVITPFLHIYFDLIGAFIQAYVFTLLTTIYWANETEEGTEEVKVKKPKKSKQIRINQTAY